MNCPTCPDERLVMADRQGIEIDYCPACRGIWLDRGELDKLLDRANPGQRWRGGDASPRQGTYERDGRPTRHDERSDERGGARRRRGGVLSDLLDFG